MFKETDNGLFTGMQVTTSQVRSGRSKAPSGKAASIRCTSETALRAGTGNDQAVPRFKRFVHDKEGRKMVNNMI